MSRTGESKMEIPVEKLSLAYSCFCKTPGKRSPKMNRFKNYLIAAAALSVLAIIGTNMNTQQAAAQGPPNGLAVRIVNPVPVPVSGTVNVGNLGATTLPIAVTNFPATQNVNGTVNIGTLPTVQTIAQNGPGSVPFGLAHLIVASACHTDHDRQPNRRYSGGD
jgi:hypothetical protein